jgi:uroporphyrinogen decarboxylase
MGKLYLDTINAENKTKQIPVWMMRQAGRYLPEYRKIRQQHSFLDMVYTPEVACEITLQPIRRFGFDAAILFSDILVTPQALGMELNFTNGVGPQFSNPIRSESDAAKLVKNAEYLNPIYETIKLLRKELPKQTTLIGFAGAPFTVASYMIEGGTSKDLKTTKKMMLTNPKLFNSILDQIIDITIDYLEQQVYAGAEALQLFDTWISHLDWDSAKKYSSDLIDKIITELRARDINQPITVFGKQTSVFYPLYATTGTNIISFDWNADLGLIDRELNSDIGIQGNLDPFILYSSTTIIAKKTKSICSSIRSSRPFIFNLGHGLMPDIPIDSVQCVIDTIRSI